MLGWSMGGMIAQALAVLHPGQVRRLVLCATFPGVGTVIPPQAKINDLTNGNGLSVLFPADQPMAADAFSAGAQSYADAEAASAGVISAQGEASLSWFHGTDAAGRLTSRISVPTLVADGAEDQLDAVSNSRALAGLIPGAKLLIYPDAGHGFLFQEGTPFAVTVESFLSGPARPAARPRSGRSWWPGRRRSPRPARRGSPSSRGCRRSPPRPGSAPSCPPARPRLRSTGLTSRSPAPWPPSTPGCCRPGRPGRWGMRSRRS